MATTTNGQAVVSSYNPTTPTLNIYGSGSDLSNAKAKYNGMQGVNFYDTSQEGFDPNSMNKGIMLGGSGVNTNVSDNMLSSTGTQRLGGATSADTSNALNNYMSSWGKPTTPTQIATPTYTPFSYTGNLQTNIAQAQTQLAPQLQQEQNTINQNYDTNLIPQANNDTLSRGLARSSYAGNRMDQVNSYRSRDLTNAQLANQQQANNLGMQMYNTDYDRQYQNWKDNNANAWQTYNANNDNAWKNYNANVQQYNTDTANNHWNQQFNNDNYWKNIGQQNTEKQLGISQQEANDKGLYYNAIANKDNAMAGNYGSGLSRTGRGRSSGSSSAATKANQSSVDKAAYENFNALSSPEDQYALLNNPDFQKSVSTSMQKSLRSAYQSNLKGYVKNESDVANSNGVTSDMTTANANSWMNASQPTWDYTDAWNGPTTDDDGNAVDAPIYSGGR